MLEVSEVALVKGDKNRHDLAGGQTPFSVPTPLPQARLRHKTKIVHVTKQRFPIHGILSSLASLPGTVERILFCAQLGQDDFLKQNSGF